MHRLFYAIWLLLLLVAYPRASKAQPITVGSVTLAPCVAHFDGYCGSIRRPLDPSGAIPGTIKIAFELYPHTSQTLPQLETIIAQEGGPGYSTRGSKDGYVRLLTPLRTQRDILLIDKRGTGFSQAIDCPALQKDRKPRLPAVAACGAQLGDTAWLYGSDYAADDVAAVLEALNTGPVDYYGDSYATFFGQVFAVRHPDLLRAVVLDSAYPVLGEHGYFRSEIENFMPSLQKVCARSVSCRSLGGGATSRFLTLLNALRAQPVTGTAPGASGEQRTVTANPGGLFVMVYGAGDNLIPYRDIDAAGRAYLENGDAVPLLRLVAEAEDGDAGGGPADQFSTGLETAVVCSDYTQLFDMRDSVHARRQQYAAAIARTEADHPGVYAPFTLAEVTGAYGNPEMLNFCVVWPTAPALATPGFPVPKSAVFPSVPVLVLNGELDTVTSPREADEAAALFPNVQHVVLYNSGHEVAVGDEGFLVPPYGGDLADCAGPIVLRFLASAGDAGDTSCARQVAPIRTVPAFATAWDQVSPATARAGNEADTTGLTLAAAAVATVGDVVARYYVCGGTDSGLRGGKFQVHAYARGYRFALHDVQWTNDLTATGQIVWDQDDGSITADVVLKAAGHRGTLTVTWNNRLRDAKASLSGRIDGQTVEAEMLAP